MHSFLHGQGNYEIYQIFWPKVIGGFRIPPKLIHYLAKFSEITFSSEGSFFLCSESLSNNSAQSFGLVGHEYRQIELYVLGSGPGA